ncbi:hypothetical protein LTR66_017221, partial [Elasticomyces elasticus]
MDIESGLLSPTPSIASTTTSPANTNLTPLPIPRSKPIHPGSTKETDLIHFLDKRILHINARYAKRVDIEGSRYTSVPGYTSFDQVIADMDPVLDIAWMSGTITIQVAYLLNLASMICDFMPSFDFTNLALQLISKFDEALSTLLDDNHKKPPAQVSVTDKVRMKSIVEDTRLVTSRLAAASSESIGEHPAEDIDDEDDDLGPGFGQSAAVAVTDENHADDVVLSVGNIYEKT